MRFLAIVVTLLALSAQGPAEEATDALVKSAHDQFVLDIHSQKGLTCVSCHQRMDKPGKSNVYTIRRSEIPALCGSCHSDAGRMKQYNPSLHTDQLAQYKTSVHGVKFAHGDTRVAVCTDCHTTHSIRPASDPHSSTHPLNVATTCKHCHSDSEYMKPYGIATDQFDGYVDSVHYKAMVESGDLSAPTCTTCHGSHGAAPPGVVAVANVCATCHVLQGKFFEESPHKQAFAKLELPSCVTCHEGHRIHHPDDDFVGTGKTAICATCHIASEPAGQVADGTHNNFRHLATEIVSAKSLLDSAAHAGMDVADADMELSQANDALAKARVSLHSAQPALVAADLEAGAKVVARAQAAGIAAMKERDNRRKAIVLPVMALVGLFLTAGLYIRVLERKD
jgi:predicted CXXCH cytochrome family protein